MANIILKNLAWLGVTAALTFGIDRLAGYALQKVVDKSQFRYSRLYNLDQTPDFKPNILLVGNSRGLTFYQPTIKELTWSESFNLSYNGMPADLADVLVRDFLDRRTPKIMLLDITLCDRVNDALIKDFRTYANKSFRLDTLISSYDAYIAGGAKFSHLYRANSENFQRALYYRNKSDEDWLLDRVIAQSMLDETDLSKYKLRMDSSMVRRLAETVRYAQSKGVDVKLVINPYLPKFASHIQDSFLIPLKQYATELTGLTVHDFSSAITENQYFGDYQHLNKSGGIEYMKLLAAQNLFSAQGETSSLSTPPPSAPEVMPMPTPNNETTTNNISNNTPTPQPHVIDERNMPLPPKPKKKIIKKNEPFIHVDTLFSN